MSIEKEEFIGKKIKIIESKNKSLAGREGTVIDETKNTITIQQEEKRKKIIKNHVVFEVEGKKIDGKRISLRPEDRIKKTKKG